MKKSLLITISFLSAVLTGAASRTTFETRYNLDAPMQMETFGVLMNIPQVGPRDLDAFSKSLEHTLSGLNITSKVFDISEGRKRIETERLMFIFNDFDPDFVMSMNHTPTDVRSRKPRELSLRFLLKKQNSPGILWEASVRLLATGDKFQPADFEQFGKQLALRMLKDGVISNGLYVTQVPLHNPVYGKAQSPPTFYIQMEGINYGPYSRIQIDQIVASDRLYLEEWAFREGESNWSKLKDLISKP